MESIVLGDIRVQLLSNDIVRVEYGKNGKFEDRNTFFIPNKSDYAETSVAHTAEENVICFGEYELYIPENAKNLSGVRLEKNGKKVYTYKKLANSGELPPLDKTPETFALSDTPRIIVPDGGYSANRTGEYEIEENVQDIYLLLCGGDAKKLRRLYVELSGRNEFVRLSTLGGWNSKYYAYSEETAKKLILDYEEHNVPLDNMVIDTDWRFCENGWGYDVNEELFPDMKRFIDFAHAHDVEIMFNDHPEPVNGAHVFEPREIAYREKNLQALMDIGLDTWWYDRNWMTNLVSPTKNVKWESFGLYLFADITANYYKKTSGNAEIYRRPVIMGNVVNIANGCYQGISDSASHRYSIQWTGDIESSPDALAQEVASMIKAGNNGIAYCNADCGGHIGNPNKEGFVRWMQFGTLSPVFRPHCTNSVKPFREPWVYDEETLDIVREYNNLRYRLLPVIYKNAHNNYETGEPIFKSLGYEYPTDKTACKLNDEYILGNDIIIKPIASKVPVAVEKKRYSSPVKATYYNGRELKGEPIATAQYNSLNIALYHTSPEKGVPVYDFSARFETELTFDRDVELIVRSDDGATVWIDGEKVLEDKTLHSAMNFPLKTVSGGIPHKIEIEYFQAGGAAVIGLFYCDATIDDKTSVYLPTGKWMDVFDGKVYDGNKTVARKYGLREMPLFVRMGAFVPLAYDAKNTKRQKWDKLVFDFYPDRSACDEGYIYEDDGETTAYKLGMFRTINYKAKYCEKCNAFVVNIEKAQGKFDGEKCYAARDAKIKFHLSDAIRDVKRVTVNGADTEFVRTAKDAEAFPFGTASACDSEIAVVSVKLDSAKDCEIKFYI